MLKKKNKYKLSKDDATRSNNIVYDAIVSYDIESDEIKTTIGIRRDVFDSPKADEFTLRVARQVENAMRTVMPSYEREMKLVEGLARLGKDVGAYPDEGE